MDPNEAQKAIDKITGGMTEEQKQSMSNAPLPQMISFMSSQVMEMMQSGEFDKSITMLTQALQGQQSGGAAGPMEVFQKLQQMNIPDIRETLKEPIRIEGTCDGDEDEEDDIKPHTADLCFTINVPLKDLYTGKKKKVKIVRNNYKKKENGTIETFEERKKLLIPISKGSKHGDQIVFPGESSRVPDYEPGNVIIKLSMDPDDLFERNGDHLFIYKNLSVAENYNLKQQITHLDGRLLTLNQAETDQSIVHLCHGMRKVVGEGMPIKGTDKKGDLFVRFNLVLPEKLSKERIEQLGAIFTKEEISEAEATDVTLELITDTDLSFFADTWSESDCSDDYSETDSELDERYDSDPEVEADETEPESEEKKEL